VLRGGLRACCHVALVLVLTVVLVVLVLLHVSDVVLQRAACC
jgi:hypothetical protein